MRGFSADHEGNARVAGDYREMLWICHRGERRLRGMTNRPDVASGIGLEEFGITALRPVEIGTGGARTPKGPDLGCFSF